MHAYINIYINTYFHTNAHRHGQGREEFGNVLGIKYTCPMGHHHQGVGYCIYVGSYDRGLFHGLAELTCLDGRKYAGDWMRGKKHGKVCIYIYIYI